MDKAYLKEIFNKVEPYPWVIDSVDETVYHFIVEDKEVEVEVSFNSFKSGSFELIFTANGSHGFEYERKAGNITELNPTESLKFFVTLKDIIKNFIKRKKPPKIFWYASHPKLDQLYLSTGPELAKETGYKFGTDGVNYWLIKKVSGRK